MNGVLVIDKPAGFTSFDAVAVLRGLTKQRKIGHCGTLDPNATGVLPVLLGCATRAQDIIPNHDKEYTASAKFGITTDTLDIWGKPTGSCSCDITRGQLENALPPFRGEIMQRPPMYSAIQVSGKRLYDLARKGVEVERESRRITVYTLKLLDFCREDQTALFSVRCSKGTYIRSLIDDIGRSLGCGAVMTGLRRTMACGYTVADAVTVERARSLADSGELSAFVRPVESLFADYRAVYITDRQALRFANGGALDIRRTSLAGSAGASEIIRVHRSGGDFIGLGVTDLNSGQLKIYKLFQKN